MSSSLYRQYVGKGGFGCIVEPGCDLKDVKSVGKFSLSGKENQREMKLVERYWSAMMKEDPTQERFILQEVARFP